jgi:hypothetical protein
VNLFINWKTSLAGVASILGARTDMATSASQGQISGHLEADITAVIAGIGLLFAKDATTVGTGK